MDCMAFTEPQSLYSRTKPLLSLCAAGPVESLTACKVELYFYTPYVPYGFYRASVPVEDSYNSTFPITLQTVNCHSSRTV